MKFKLYRMCCIYVCNVDGTGWSLEHMIHQESTFPFGNNNNNNNNK